MVSILLMEHATPPPFPVSSPPLTAVQIDILTTPLPPFPSSSNNFSPLEFFLALVVVVTIPALIYTFISAFRCPSRRRKPEQNSGEHSVTSGDGTAAAVSDIIYRKDAHVKEIGGECPVCLWAFTDDEKLRQLSGCKHSFHIDCIDLWLRNHSNCPICRATVAAGKHPKSTAAPVRDHDLHQGLPDASALV